MENTTSRKFRILVIEDKEMHRASAKETLAGHDLTIVSSFDDACEEFMYQERLPFDIVLIDMMMPMSERTLGEGVFKPNEQVPYGLVLALRAAKRGAKFVAVVTDTNHHHGAMSAALDLLGPGYYPSSEDSEYGREELRKSRFVINGARCVFVHAPFVVDILKDQPCTWCSQDPGVCKFCKGKGVRLYWKEGPCDSCGGTDKVGTCAHCKGTLKADGLRERKDWGRVLTDLVAD